MSLELLDVEAIVSFLDAVLDLSLRTRTRSAVSESLLRSLDLPFLLEGEDDPTWLADMARATGPNRSDIRRALASGSVEAFMRASGVWPGVSWVKRRRPELVLKTLDAWGVFGIETARRMSTFDERQASTFCVVCGNPVHLARRPRVGDDVYCRDIACQRERWRRNKARQRDES